MLRGRPWRGNLKDLLLETPGPALVGALLKLCEVEAGALSSATIAIDTPLGWPEAFRDLLDGGATVQVPDRSKDTPYQYRLTERLLAEHLPRPPPVGRERHDREPIHEGDPLPKSPRRVS